MEEKVEVDYWFIKDILNKKDTTVWVKLNEYTTYTWISINNVLISDADGNNNSLYHKNVVESAKALFSLADEHENFNTKDNAYKKINDIWYKY